MSKETSRGAASKAGEVLRNPKSTKAEKTAAASALSQREKAGKSGKASGKKS